jgi:hypothetical protein
MNQPLNRIILWTNPRSVSTAFARSIRELHSVKTLIDPYCSLYYYNGPGIRSPDSDPRRKLTNDTRLFDKEYKAIGDSFLAPYEDVDAVFIKDMAICVEGRYEDYISGPFSKFKHTFLIRHPKKSAISQYKVCKEGDYPFSYPGVRQVHEMYKVVQQIDPNPLVVDADDLLENPKEMMKLYCSATGLPFTEDMLKWEQEEIKECNWFPTYKLWYGAAMSSTGFRKPKLSSEEPLSNYPKIVEECVRDELPYYEALYEVRAKPIASE